MDNSILIKLDELEKLILSDNLPPSADNPKEWGGADVIIKRHLDEDTKKWLGNQPLTFSLQNTEPRRRAVITEHFGELNWLFSQLRDVFAGQIDYISKYDFYGSLAQSAIDYLESHKESKDSKPLLLEVLNKAKDLAK